MRSARQVLWGVVIALVSITLLIGVFSLSLSEGNLQKPSPSLSPTFTITLTASFSPTILVVSPTPQTPTLTPTWTPTLPPTPSNCPPPPGWLPYTTLPGDTLDGLALLYKRTSAEIRQANCLTTTSLTPGKLLYLPPLPTSTSTPTPIRTRVPCRIPSTWVVYIVQPGDTLFHLGQAFGISYTELQAGNCMTGTELVAGQKLYVPPWGTHTPTSTFPGVPTLTLPIDTPTDTPTVMPTDTDIPPSETPTIPTETPTL
jgi:LysM repeat protein